MNAALYLGGIDVVVAAAVQPLGLQAAAVAALLLLLLLWGAVAVVLLPVVGWKVPLTYRGRQPWGQLLFVCGRLRYCPSVSCAACSLGSVVYMYKVGCICWWSWRLAVAIVSGTSAAAAAA